MAMYWTRILKASKSSWRWRKSNSVRQTKNYSSICTMSFALSMTRSLLKRNLKRVAMRRESLKTVKRIEKKRTRKRVARKRQGGPNTTTSLIKEFSTSKKKGMLLAQFLQTVWLMRMYQRFWLATIIWSFWTS